MTDKTKPRTTVAQDVEALRAVLNGQHAQTESAAEVLADIARRIVDNAMPATDSGATCFVPRYQIDQLSRALEAERSLAAGKVVKNDDDASDHLSNLLMEFADMAAAWPHAKPDSRAWAHAMVYAPPAPAASVPDGHVLAPHFRGFAHLGLGRYLLFHSHADEEAELSIVPATPESAAGRTVGDLRDDGPKEIPAELMAVRLRFENVAGLDALEQQLRLLRETHFPAPSTNQEGAAPPPSQIPPDVQAVIDALPPGLEGEDQDENHHGH